MSPHATITQLRDWAHGLELHAAQYIYSTCCSPINILLIRYSAFIEADACRTLKGNPGTSSQSHIDIETSYRVFYRDAGTLLHLRHPLLGQPSLSPRIAISCIPCHIFIPDHPCCSKQLLWIDSLSYAETVFHRAFDAGDKISIELKIKHARPSVIPAAIRQVRRGCVTASSCSRRNKIAHFVAPARLFD
jgi:hypothetical protein